MPLDDAATHLFSTRTNVRVSSQRVKRQRHEKDTITLTYLLLLPFKVDCHISHPPTTAPTRTVAVATGRQQSTATQRKVRAEVTTLLLFVTIRICNCKFSTQSTTLAGILTFTRHITGTLRFVFMGRLQDVLVLQVLYGSFLTVNCKTSSLKINKKPHETRP